MIDGNNSETVLGQLAAEVNLLEADRKQGNQSKMGLMGHKLLAIREILRELNGVNRGTLDPTGHHAPAGWGNWVKNNLTISLTQAKHCIQVAVNPDSYYHRMATNKKKYYTTATFCFHSLKKNWPAWPEEEREKFTRSFLKLMDDNQ